MPEAKRGERQAVERMGEPADRHVTADSPQAIATVRNLPNRSAIGPVTNCIEPWVSA